MTLSSETPYPASRQYVLKLHREALPEQDQLIGRLENMSSGRHYDFTSADELVACFALDVALSHSDKQSASR
jgi:hypothetical protein